MARSKNHKKLLLKLIFYSKVLTSLLLILAGVTLISFSAKNYFEKPEEVKPEIRTSEVKKPQPIKIIIPKISKSLNITQGEFKNDRWTVAENGVSYLSSSSLPGDHGNSVIYGHNLNNIFGRLYEVKNDDYLYVVLNNGQIVKYKVFETKQIKPTDIEILNETKDNRLTIYTCSGFLDQARFVVVAQEVYKS